MSQIFHRSTNTIAKASIAAVIVLIAGAGFAAWEVNNSYNVYLKEPLDQPVPFSHKHHTMDDGIDCRYCHNTVETSWYAGMPTTHTCMTCHSQLFVTSPILEPVRESYRTGKSIAWARVNSLPDFVYFNHSIHINKGIGCTTCHGQIGTMPITYRENTLYMRWCINCHKHPERYVRPRAQVFDAVYTPPPMAEQIQMGRKLVKEYKIQSLTTCETCHR
jgi:hypothetical protein